METRRIDEIIWREDLYPRFAPEPSRIQQYAEVIELLPPIEINQRNELIDGYHRWTAHKKAELETIAVTVTETASDAELDRLMASRNADGRIQLTNEEKKRKALQWYVSLDTDKQSIADALKVTLKTVNRWLASRDRDLKKERQRKITEMWLSCRTDMEIADAVGLSRQAMNVITRDLLLLDNWEKVAHLSARYDDKDWKPPLYDIWTFPKNDNKTKHYGNTHVGVVDNLLYTFTEPFDIVIDPFGGGGSTIDICKKRLRRYWVSDRKPVPERRDIREHDLIDNGNKINLAGPYHWGDVSLVYLDPPYWKQAAGKYSDDPTDLSNMTLDQFTTVLTEIIEAYGDKLKPGAHIACITSPTQWPNEDKSVNYHDLDLASAVTGQLKLVRRVVCPYSTEQYNGTQVEIAKEDKIWLVLSRTMLVWERV